MTLTVVGPVTPLHFCYDSFLLHQSYPFTLLRFCTKTEGKRPFLYVHIDLSDNRYGAKDIRFCTFTLLRFLKVVVGHCSVFKDHFFVAFLCRSLCEHFQKN